MKNQKTKMILFSIPNTLIQLAKKKRNNKNQKEHVPLKNKKIIVFRNLILAKYQKKRKVKEELYQ